VAILIQNLFQLPTKVSINRFYILDFPVCHASSPPAVKGGHQSTPQRFDKRQMGVQLSWKLEQYDGASTLFDINSMMSILTVFFQDSNPGYVSIMTLRVLSILGMQRCDAL